VVVVHIRRYVLLIFFVNDGYIMELVYTKFEAIICPNCGLIVKGEIKQYNNVPFLDYYGHCHKCGYSITESDWERAGDSSIID
jgi:C4-type Zn-finger protein